MNGTSTAETSKPVTDEHDRIFPCWEHHEIHRPYIFSNVLLLCHPLVSGDPLGAETWQSGFLTGHLDYRLCFLGSFPSYFQLRTFHRNTVASTSEAAADCC